MHPTKSALEPILSTGALLIIRTSDADSAYDIAKAAVAGGIRALEIPYAVPDTLRLVERLVTDFGADGVSVGVGTVIDEVSAYRAVESGADILVSPGFNQGMLDVANRYQVTSVSGAMTPTEILRTAEAGADIVKLFPAEFLGPAYLKSVRAPLSQIPISPTGGVDADTVGEWISAGACCVGVASYICKAGDATAITASSRTLLAAIEQARG